MDKLTNALDMQRDEFRRIVALNPSIEIVGICERAITEIEQVVPMVVQRDDLISDKRKLWRALAELVGVDSERELDQMETVLRAVPGIEKDKVAAINAIHALQETRENP
jgi:hypothetical protein